MKVAFNIHCIFVDDNSSYDRYYDVNQIDEVLSCLDSFFSSGLFCLCNLYIAVNPDSDDAYFRLVKSYEL